MSDQLSTDRHPGSDDFESGVNDDDLGRYDDDRDDVDSEEDENSDSIDFSNENDDEMAMLMAYADFLNRLINFKFIPISTVNEISAEYLEQAYQSSKVIEGALRKSLNKIPNINADIVEEIVRENVHDPFVKAQEELLSELKRAKNILN